MGKRWSPLRLLDRKARNRFGSIGIALVSPWDLRHAPNIRRYRLGGLCRGETGNAQQKQADARKMIADARRSTHEALVPRVDSAN